MLQLNAFSSEIQPYSYLGSSFGEIVLYFHENELFVSNHAVGLYPEVFYDVVLRTRASRTLNGRDWSAAPSS
jgi:hypothetical protein